MIKQTEFGLKTNELKKSKKQTRVTRLTDQEIHFEPIIRLKVKSETKDQSIWSGEFQI